jgi:hypothetical protein
MTPNPSFKGEAQRHGTLDSKRRGLRPHFALAVQCTTPPGSPLTQTLGCTEPVFTCASSMSRAFGEGRCCHLLVSALRARAGVSKPWLCQACASRISRFGVGGRLLAGPKVKAMRSLVLPKPSSSRALRQHQGVCSQS